jgi:predicted RecB family nuclease
MQRNECGVLLSASDLMRFSGCAHATTLDLARMMGRGAAPVGDSEDAELLQRHGDAHEARHLARLRTAGRGVVEIVKQGQSLAQGVAATRAALAHGAEVVFQGALAGGAWGGWSDFLERVERPSALGAWSYEVSDTKLKRKPHPKHVLQLALYSDLLAEVQGAAPERTHVELGDGTRATIRLDDVSAYTRRVRARLEAFVAEPQPTRPVPCADCPLCRWREVCATELEGEDSLYRVANVTRGQVAKLEAEGVTTMAGLAARVEPVRGLAPETLARLVTQAGLQVGRGAGGGPAHALRPALPGKGFDLLPAPDPGDLFYDIEGDPHVEGGLEYLHGLWAPDIGFRPIWAHDREAERAALVDLLDAFRDRIAAHPGARIYHYASYEVTALRRLTALHGVGEAFLDRLLRERRFVDLYAVVRGGVIASEPDYSIKSLEVFTGIERAGEVKTAGGSVVAYERWLEERDDAILAEIEDYNRIDCISTEKLRDWLVAIRPEGPWPTLAPARGDAEAEADAEAAALQAMLAGSGLDTGRRQLLFDLGFFHRREAKPAWWAIFDSLGRDTDELIDDLDCLGGLEAIGPVRREKQSIVRDYRFPEQETRLKAGTQPTAPLADPYVTLALAALDRGSRTATVKVGADRDIALPDRLSLHPPRPLPTDVLAAAVRDMIADQCGSRQHRAIDDLLARRAPRLDGGLAADILGGADPVAGTVRAVLAMQDTVLPIQGPPGTGKTYVAARAILALVASGRRVAVASTSHEAIGNVLRACLAALPDDAAGLTLEHVELAHKIGDVDPYDPACPIERVTANGAAALRDADVVGGTAFLFSRPAFEGAFDTLVVDEAGQVGLANLLAMGRCARNIVLVGDPRQLPQVVQGAHPGDAGLSCLDWLLGAHATVPPDRGILLPVTWRMHPALCRFVSGQVYEGRLASHPDTARQRVSGTRWPEAGAHLVEVPHAGNAQVSHAEIAAIRAAIVALTAGTWTDRDGVTRPLREEDIIVVAPYNAQVNALRAALPERVRVGTVDKFQGQEAPVCLVSMTASSIEDVPRGMGFLFSLNRINVAVSRAKALALVFASPRLLDARCATVEEVRLVNTLCALPVAAGDPA